MNRSVTAMFISVLWTTGAQPPSPLQRASKTKATDGNCGSEQSEEERYWLSRCVSHEYECFCSCLDGEGQPLDRWRFNFWMGWTETCLCGPYRDIPIRGLEGWGFYDEQAALNAAAGKVIKYENLYMENQDLFIQFAFDTFGFLAPDVVELLNRVQ